MPIHTLTELQYSTDRKGPFGLYVYEPNSDYHRGAIWFRDKPKYPDEEITTTEAKRLVDAAMVERREIRITDSGDMLVYHAQRGTILYGADFWKELP